MEEHRASISSKLGQRTTVVYVILTLKLPSLLLKNEIAASLNFSIAELHYIIPITSFLSKSVKILWPIKLFTELVVFDVCAFCSRKKTVVLFNRKC